MLNVTTETFEAEVLKETMPVVVDFWAPWCGPCKAFAPTFEALSAEYAGRFKFVSVNVDEQPELARQYGVRGIPTLTVFKEGASTKTIVGGLNKTIVTEALNAL